MCINITILTERSGDGFFDLKRNNDFGFNIQILNHLSSAQLKNGADVYIIDYFSSQSSGFAAARELRNKSRSGIILIGTTESSTDRIVALEMGADDYITPPINYRELSARIRNLGRWSRLSNSTDTPEEENQVPVSMFAGWQLNHIRQVLKSPSGQLIKLARNEFLLLKIMLDNRNKLMTREQLLNYLYNRDWHPSDRTIDMLIGKLRKKLNDYKKEKALINTVYGTGYIFACDEQ